MSTIDHIGVIGAGSWGTALAATAARAGHRVTMWARSADLCERINRTHENADYLPGIDLPKSITVTNAPGDLADCNAVLIVTPAQAMRPVMLNFAGILPDGTPAAICCKGIETSTGKFMNNVLAEVCAGLTPAVLSGPSFAADVVKGLPTAVTLAAADLALAEQFARAITITSFRVYPSNDVEGVELCGAAKNVMAIACGIASGKGMGESAKAALITRGFAELSRLAAAMNVQPATLTGLSGLGDLILTCSSSQSRNFSLGVALGQGQTVEQHMAGRRTVAEGAPTSAVLVDLARNNDVEMPICEAVAAIVGGQSSADEEIARLLARPVRSE